MSRNNLGIFLIFRHLSANLWHNIEVNTFRRILAFVLLVVFCSGQISATSDMADIVIEHSLDELPSFNMEEVLPETQVIHETIETPST